jgi:hypothetical protein
LVALGAFAVVACGGPNHVDGGVTGPQSAKSVADDSSDFKALKRCPESGPYDSYLKAEQAKSPDQYTSDKKNWDQLKAAGANDAFIVVYSDSDSNCGQFVTTNVSGKLAVVLAVRFKDAPAAASSYTSAQGQFHLKDSDLTNLKSLGAVVQQGAASGLGDNSTTVAFDGLGLSLYVALWQKKAFEAAVAVDNLPPTTGATAAAKVNGRIA